MLRRAISTNKHSANEDAVIIAVASIEARSSSAPKLLIIASEHHVDHLRNAKNLVEQFLKTEECWYEVVDLDQIPTQTNR